MTVHGVRVKTSTEQESNPDFVPEPGPPELANVLPERVVQHIKYNFNPVLEGQESPMSKVGGSDSLGNVPEHVSGVYRFKGSDDKKSLLDSIESKVTADCKWAKIESHVCTHDNTTRTVEKTRELPDGSTETYTVEVEGCSNWKTERTKGNVPEGI